MQAEPQFLVEVRFSQDNKNYGEWLLTTYNHIYTTIQDTVNTGNLHMLRERVLIAPVTIKHKEMNNRVQIRPVSNIYV